MVNHWAFYVQWIYFNVFKKMFLFFLIYQLQIFASLEFDTQRKINCKRWNFSFLKWFTEKKTKQLQWNELISATAKKLEKINNEHGINWYCIRGWRFVCVDACVCVCQRKRTAIRVCNVLNHKTEWTRPRIGAQTKSKLSVEMAAALRKQRTKTIFKYRSWADRDTCTHTDACTHMHTHAQCTCLYARGDAMCTQTTGNVCITRTLEPCTHCQQIGK